MNSTDIMALHTGKIGEWRADGVHCTEKEFLAMVEQNHRFNFQLWNAEDRARREDKGFEFVYQAKREIDHCNQQRNNWMERMDQYLWENLDPSQSSDCPTHSETPGMMIDRLSILALKHYHMEQQTLRDDATPEHRAQCREKLAVINAQRLQLGQCFDALLEEVRTKQRSFKVYFQFKMYNDPTLNPELYQTAD